MNAVIYSKQNCPYCVQAKALLQKEGISYKELEIGKDIIREEFQEIYPDQKTVPLVFINGEKIGGYTELVEWFGNRPELLVESC